MPARRSGPVLLAATVVAGLVLVPVGPAAAAEGTTLRVSVLSGGDQLSGASWAPVVGQGGGSVLFQSDAAALGRGDGTAQLYLPITENDQQLTFGVSDVPGGVSGEHDMSDGLDAIPVFIARGDDLVQNAYASPAWYRNGPTKLSVGPGGEPADADSTEVRISDVYADASGEPRAQAVFVSEASNLVPGDEPGSEDVFIVDAMTSATRQLTDGDVGGVMDGLAISADGSTVAVASSSDLDPTASTPGNHVFLIDAVSGVATALGLPGETFAPTLSGDGRLVTFLTEAALVADDGDGTTDAYLVDRTGGPPLLLSEGPGGEQVDHVVRAELSDDGSTVVFAAPGGLVPEAAEASLNYVYVRRLATGQIQVASVPDLGQPPLAAGASLGPRSTTADGGHVAFTTEDALIGGDTNGTSDVYLRTLGTWPPPPPGTIGLLSGDAATVATGEEATEAQPVVLSMAVPAGLYGPVTVEPQPNDPAVPSGYSLLDAGASTSLEIHAPPAAAADPYVLTLTVDASLLGGISPADVQVFRNGDPVPDCTAATAAEPDPCVGGRTAAGDDAVLTIRTTAFSTWSVGRLAYDVDGSFPPVDPLPTLNRVKAGSAVPVKFALGGDRGLDVFADGYPLATTADCSGAADQVEESVSSAGASLSYADGVYTYVWKTVKGAAGCRDLVLRFRDGTELTARFELR